MDYLILCEGEPIGTMVNPAADHTMGMVHGPFWPLPAYEKVRTVFRLFAEATDDAQHKHYYRKRDALNLTVTTAAGRSVPAAWVHIYDLAEDAGNATGYEAEFNVDDYRFFFDQRTWDGTPYPVQGAATF